MDARVAASLAVLLLLAPSAQAGSATGRFVATGGLSLPEGAQEDLQAVGAYFGAHEGGFAMFRLEARTLRVHRYETEYLEARGLPLQPNFETSRVVATYTLTDAVVTLAEGDHRGWLGLYLPQEGAPLTSLAGGHASILAQAAVELGEGLSGLNEAETGPEPGSNGYDWKVQSPLLLLESVGIVHQSGAGSLKLQGPDLRFSSRENDTTYETGTETAGSDPVRNRVGRWFFLEYEGAQLTLGAAEPFQVAARSARAAWSGPATFRPVEGQMVSDGAAYEASGERARVSGDLSALLAPLRQGGEVRLRVDLSGDLVETTLQPQGGVPVPTGPRPDGWGVFVGVAAVVGVAALVTVTVLRRRDGPASDAVTPEERLALARMEAGRERFQEAVAHVRRARAQAPTSVRLLLEEASYLGAMGKVEEALRHYATAAELDPEGDADFQAAVLLLQSGGDLDRAEALAVKALARSPILVLEALYDVSGTFDALRGRPAFDAAVRAARESLGEEGA